MDLDGAAMGNHEDQQLQAAIAMSLLPAQVLSTASNVSLPLVLCSDTGFRFCLARLTLMQLPRHS